MVTTMLRHFDQEERQPDGSRHRDSIKLVLMEAFAHEPARDFDNVFLRFGSNIAKKKMGIYVFPSFSWRLWWYSNKSRIDEMHAYSIQLERIHLQPRKFVGFSVKRQGQGSPSSLSNTTESFWKGPGREEASFRLHSSCSLDIYWVRLKKAQDQGLQFWRTESFAIMT